MYCILDISLYPLDNDYSESVRRFVERLGQTDLDFSTTETSTVVRGEYDDVFDIVREAMRDSLASPGRKAFVLKVMNTE